MLSKISQKEKDKCRMASLICGIFFFFKKANFKETENRVVVGKGWGEIEMDRGKSNCTHFKFEEE